MDDRVGGPPTELDTSLPKMRDWQNARPVPEAERDEKLREMLGEVLRGECRGVTWRRGDTTLHVSIDEMGTVELYDMETRRSGYVHQCERGVRASPILGEPSPEASVPRSFRSELAALINRHSQERYSNTPDFLLAGFMDSCLSAFNIAARARDEWYGVALEPGRARTERPQGEP